MSGLDHLRGRAAECDTLLSLIGGDAGRIIGQRLQVWRDAIAAVEPDYAPAEMEDETPEHDDDQAEDAAADTDDDGAGPPPCEADTAWAAQVVADAAPPAQPTPTPAAICPPQAIEPAPASARNFGRAGGVWTPERIALGQKLYEQGLGVNVILGRINALDGAQKVASAQAFYVFASERKWQRPGKAARSRAAPPQLVQTPVHQSPAPQAAGMPDSDIADAMADIRAGKRALWIRDEYGCSLEEAQALCERVDREAKGEAA